MDLGGNFPTFTEETGLTGLLTRLVPPSILPPEKTEGYWRSREDRWGETSGKCTDDRVLPRREGREGTTVELTRFVSRVGVIDEGTEGRVSC